MSKSSKVLLTPSHQLYFEDFLNISINDLENLYRILKIELFTELTRSLSISRDVNNKLYIYISYQIYRSGIYIGPYIRVRVCVFWIIILRS